MKLISFETSRIVYMTLVHRPGGAPHLPEAAAKLIQRYSFAKFPSLEDLSKDSQTFGYGKFEDVQITELSLYGDGVIVAGKCSTEILDKFLEDFFLWAADSMNVVRVPDIKSEKHFESNIVVRSNVSLAEIVAPNQSALDMISKTLTVKTSVEFQPAGTLFDCDQAAVSSAKLRRKPMRFLIERRYGLPYADDFYYCQAPLKTNDHLALLEKLEIHSNSQ